LGQEDLLVVVFARLTALVVTKVGSRATRANVPAAASLFN